MHEGHLPLDSSARGQCRLTHEAGQRQPEASSSTGDLTALVVAQADGDD
jgi:hypothetical protein